ncbi:hypothetical protein HOLleu_22071 [Holothuria leucospilota]|uniref:Uncharacterized protein n=1 Tax=Holothuria leucospilota TaxID=206669 RepID=A0A9Q1BYW6_HOLLE|nr:hypothetical protein HOLleu_22071 [Holothuria leucospilota]
MRFDTRVLFRSVTALELVIKEVSDELPGNLAMFQQTIQRAALGRVATIGALYDVRTERFLVFYGKNSRQTVKQPSFKPQKSNRQDINK